MISFLRNNIFSNIPSDCLFSFRKKNYFLKYFKFSENNIISFELTQGTLQYLISGREQHPTSKLHQNSMGDGSMVYSPPPPLGPQKRLWVIDGF